MTKLEHTLLGILKECERVLQEFQFHSDDEGESYNNEEVIKLLNKIKTWMHEDCEHEFDWDCGGMCEKCGANEIEERAGSIEE